jgi:hypothetical protein
MPFSAALLLLQSRLPPPVEEVSVVRVAEISDETWFDGNRFFSKINVNM